MIGRAVGGLSLSFAVSRCCMCGSAPTSTTGAQAVNMRGDADTVGAITGQLAGAIYGLEQLPESWREAVTRYVAPSNRARATGACLAVSSFASAHPRAGGTPAKQSRCAP